MSKTIKAACLQMCSGSIVDDNLANAAKLLSQAAEQGVQLAILPEIFACMTQNQTVKLNAAKSSQHILNFLSQQAAQHQMCIVAGSILYAAEHDDKPRNRCYVFSCKGTLQTYYDKIHLFDANLSTEHWQESAHIQAGTSPMITSYDQDWQMGLSICYDLRFPELYRYYSAHSCHILTVPAAFTTPTGFAHWEVLLRARAIENQCYVLAAGQSGNHEDGRTTYGHSMIIDPWGEVIAELATGEGIIIAELSLEHLQHIRQHLPVLQHIKDMS